MRTRGFDVETVKAMVVFVQQVYTTAVAANNQGVDLEPLNEVCNELADMLQNEIAAVSPPASG